MSSKTEDKNEKFKRISVKRVQSVLKNIELIENLSNKNNYKYTDSQVDQIFEAIENRLNEAKETYKSKSSKSKFTFKDE